MGLALLGLASALPARAGDVEAARRAFADGVQLFRVGDYEGARRLFLKADAEHHAPAIVYNLGMAEERLGHPQPAVDAYEAYVAEAGESGEFSSSATVAIAQLKARSTRLRISTEPVSNTASARSSPMVCRFRTRRLRRCSCSRGITSWWHRGTAGAPRRT